MPFALVFIGLIMIVTGAKGTHKALGQQLTADFTGPGNFFYWITAVGVLGAIGSIPGFKPFSRMFMTLVIVAMVIANGGVFNKFMSALKTGPIAPNREGSGDKNANTQAANMVSKGASDLQSTVANSLSTVEKFRQENQPAQNSNAWNNFKTTVGVLTKFF